MQERSSILQVQRQADQVKTDLLPPLDPPDRPRVLFRLYSTVDPEHETETMDAHEYALFCTDYAGAMQEFAANCRLKLGRGEKYKQLGNRLPTQEDCTAAELLSAQAEKRRSAVEAYVADPKAAPAPPAVDVLRAEFANDPPSCPNRLGLLLRYAGHDVARQRKLESLTGTPESPWSLCWSSTHRLWFWHEPVLDDGFNGSTWLRPVRKSDLRRVLKAKVKAMLSDNLAEATSTFNAIDKIQTSRELQAHIADPEQLLKDIQYRALVAKEAQAAVSEREQTRADINSAPQRTPSAIAAVSVVLGYDYRLLPNQPREYIAGAEERPLLSPSGLALDRDSNRLFVSEKHRIRALLLNSDAPADVIAGFRGTDPGQIAGFVDGDGAEARFNSPGALVFDPVSKLLYVADTGNHAIRAVEETDSGWRVTTVVGTGAPGGFGGPALEYSGRVTLQRHVNELVDKAKEIAVLTVGQKHMLPPEEQALLSKARSTGFRQNSLNGDDERSRSPTVEWRASVEPLYKQELLPEMDGKPIMLPAQVKGSVETTHDGMPRERMLVRSEDSRRCQDIAPLTVEEVERSVDVCIDICGAKGLAESSVDGEERGYAAVITWGPGASSLSGEDGSGTGADGLRLLRQRKMRLEPGEFGQSVGQGCRRWCTALASGPDPVWNEFIRVRVPHGESIEIVVDVWSAASLCAPQAIALSPAVGNDHPEILIGCGDTQEPGAPEAQAEVARCDAALSVLGVEDARVTRSIETGKLTEKEQTQLKSRQAELKREQETLVERRRTAQARSTAAHSIRSFQPSAGTRADCKGVLRSLVRGGEGIVDPCAIVVQPHPSQRRYVVMEGCSHRLVQLQPNGYFRPLATLHENSSAVCCTPSGASMYTADTCAHASRDGGLHELGRLRQAKFQWQWGEEKLLPARVEWHNFDEADHSVIEELYRDYVSGRVGNAHIAQFTMPKDRAADLSALNVFRFAESYLKKLNRTSNARRVPTEPIVHLLRNYGVVRTPGKRGRLLDFETMRTAIDSTLRRPITQYTRVGPRTCSLSHITGLPMGDPVRGKVGGFFSEWVKVRWDDVERDKQVITLIAEYRKKDRKSAGGAVDLKALSSSELRAEAVKIKDQAFRRQLNDIYIASLRNVPGADRAHQDLMRRKAKATRSGANADSSANPGEPLLRSPWIETSSLKVLMMSGSRSDGDDASVLPQVESPRPEQHVFPRKHAGKVPRALVSETPSPIERWLLARVGAGAIPWLEPLAESPLIFREFSRSLETKIFQPGRTIIAGGKGGAVDQMSMYILTAGVARATGKLDHTLNRYPPEQTVMEYSTLGQAFGELAMLSESHYVRAATVKAVEKCTVLVVNRALFMQFIQNDAFCMKHIRDHEPAGYWGEYKDLKQPAGSVGDSGSDTQQKRVSRPVSRPRVRPAAAPQTRQQANARAKAVTRMWTSGPGGGGPVTALPADLNWRELRRSDVCTTHIVCGGNELPLRDPRAILPLDERTLLVADRWVDENTSLETGAIWKIDLDMLKLADDLRAVADDCIRTKFYKRALDGYTTSDAIFSRNAVLQSMILKTTALVKEYGNEPGSGPSPSQSGQEGKDDDDDDDEDEEEG